ncbi:putative uncharacterized protein [Acetobacter sp. CAG:977]|nr:putative uncharacterized protein [Acetobacter sp. CAG:977]
MPENKVSKFIEDVNEIEKEISKILKDEKRKGNFKSAIETYMYQIQDELYNTDLSDDDKSEEFIKVYADYYGMTRRGKDFCKEYFKIMEKLKGEINLDFETVFDRVYEIAHTDEVSFSSKMLHTINPDLPIWDSIVAEDHFGMKVRYYKAYLREFNKYKLSKKGQYVIGLFDKICGDLFGKDSLEANKAKACITDTKKIDFVLWQCREEKKNEKNGERFDN